MPAANVESFAFRQLYTVQVHKQKRIKARIATTTDGRLEDERTDASGVVQVYDGCKTAGLAEEGGSFSTQNP